MAEKRFVPSYSKGAINIIIDTKTGVQYLIYNTLGCCAMTVLMDKNGKPMVDESFINYST